MRITNLSLTLPMNLLPNISRSVTYVISTLSVGLLTPLVTHAHEAYVLEPETFSSAWSETGVHILNALTNFHNLQLFVMVVTGVLIVLILNFRLRHSGIGRAFNLRIRRWEQWAPLIIRMFLGGALIAGAFAGAFFGPEIPLDSLAFSELLQPLMLAMGILILLGLFTEVVGAIGILVFLAVVAQEGVYLFTYANYLGEFIVLAIFGSRFWSLDGWIFGQKRILPDHLDDDTEALIVRAFYGVSLIFAAITVKLLHPAIPVAVIEQYNLTQFNWLFPSDPLLIVLGAGLVEITIGLFIMAGWETRLTVLVSLFYMTLSLIYFGEAVWPHLMLYGIGIGLLINDGGRFTLDNYFDRRLAHEQPSPPRHIRYWSDAKHVVAHILHPWRHNHTHGTD